MFAGYDKANETAIPMSILNKVLVPVLCDTLALGGDHGVADTDEVADARLEPRAPPTQRKRTVRGTFLESMRHQHGG
jgi:hypothetical protein